MHYENMVIWVQNVDTSEHIMNMVQKQYTIEYMWI